MYSEQMNVCCGVQIIGQADSIKEIKKEVKVLQESINGCDDTVGNLLVYTVSVYQDDLEKGLIRLGFTQAVEWRNHNSGNIVKMYTLTLEREED